MPHLPLQPSPPGTWHRQRPQFQQRIRNPDAREIGLALCDAMITWDCARGPTPSLDLFTAAIDSGAMWVSHSAAHHLGFILPLHGDPFDLAVGIWRRVRALGRSRLAWEADRVCAAMTRAQAVEFRALGLQDRSKVVRGDAVYVAATSELKELLPLLLALSQSEPDPRIRRLAEISYHLLDCGYLIEPRTDEYASYDNITVLCDKRRRGLGIGRLSTAIKRSVIEEFGIDRVAAELAQHGVDLSPLSWEAADTGFD